MVAITGTLSAVEINSDVVAVGVETVIPDVLPSQEGASVVITEIPALSDGAISIGE